MGATVANAGKQAAVRLPGELVAAAERAQRDKEMSLAQLMRYALRKLLREEGFMGEANDPPARRPRR